jgi:glycosyltransferase involved in cell wall biosynthesis
MHKVLLVANSGWGLANFRLPLAKILSDSGMEVVFVSPRDEHVSKLVDAGFRWVEWGLSRRGILPVAEAMATVSLTAIYRRERPQAVQHFAIKSILYGTLAAGFAGVKSVTNTFTGIGFPFLDTGGSKLARPFLSPLIGRLLHRPGVVTIFHNEEDRRFMVEKGLCPPDRAVVILGSGVDTKLYRPRPASGSGPSSGTGPNDNPVSPPSVVMVARMLIDKGVREYVGAADLLASKGVEAHYLLAGSPDLGSRLSITVDQYERWKRESAVEFLGFKADIHNVIADSDIAVLPSYHEGLPLFLLEAMSCGLPVVATDVVGCRSVVKHEVNGLLVPAKNVAALADAIERLVSDPELRAELGAAGRRMAIERFDQHLVLPQYAKLLADQLAGTVA